MIRILGISASRLRYWERTEFLRPIADGSAREPAPAPAFGFDDLLGMRAALSLRARGVPLQRIRRTVSRLQRRMPDLDRPLLRLRALGGASAAVVVEDRGVLLDPSGQLLLDFRPAAAGPVAELPGAHPEDRETAVGWFERGCAADSDPRSFGRAITAYRRAIELDPNFADAHCNLGTVLFNQGKRTESKTCFEQALALAPQHREAHFNLANVLEEEGLNQGALRHFKAAAEIDPFFVDARLNLALLYEKLGLRRAARAHWRAYLQLEPQGAWAKVARMHLLEAPR